MIQQYTASVSILNHNFTRDLSIHQSSDFTLQSKRVQNMVRLNIPQNVIDQTIVIRHQ